MRVISEHVSVARWQDRVGTHRVADRGFRVHVGEHVGVAGWKEVSRSVRCLCVDRQLGGGVFQVGSAGVGCVEYRIKFGIECRQRIGAGLGFSWGGLVCHVVAHDAE